MNQNYTNTGTISPNHGGNNPNYIPSQSTYPPYMNNPGYVNNNQTAPHPDPQYAENLFELNHGKKVSVYFSYPDSVEWRDKVFTGIIQAAGRDYVLLKNEQGQIVLLWLIYINYAIFDDEISY